MSNEEKIRELERSICEQISYLREQHAKQLEPLYRRLVDLRNMLPMPPIVIHRDLLNESFTLNDDKEILGQLLRGGPWQ